MTSAASSTESRSELRAFAANLLMVGDGLFFGALFFTYVFRRSDAPEWRAAWNHIDGAPLRLGLTLALLAGAWGVYGKRGRSLIAALLGGAAAAVLVTFVSQTVALHLESGSRAAAIALLSCVVVFALHAIGLALGGLIAKGEPVFRRFLLFQFVAALLILPVVFAW